MTTVTVSSTNQLVQAVAAAKAGETILLEPGVYNNVDISNANFAQNVTIQSAIASDPATITQMFIESSSGLLFRNFNFAATQGDYAEAYNVEQSSNIHFSSVDVHGPLNESPTVITLSGMLFENDTACGITDSKFQNLSYGIGDPDDTGLTISKNTFVDLSATGIAGGGSSDVRIYDNTFSSTFIPTGEHAQYIQFWTAGTTASARGISIIDNHMYTGSGDQIQGIFIQDDAGNLPFENVEIEGNVLVGVSWNAIYLQDARNATVVDNSLTSYTDMDSRISLQEVVGGTVDDNGLGQWNIVNCSDLSYAGNYVITAETPIVAAVATTRVADAAQAHPVSDRASAFVSAMAAFTPSGGIVSVASAAVAAGQASLVATPHLT